MTAKTKVSHEDYVYTRLKARLQERNAKLVRLEVKQGIWERFRAAQLLSGKSLFDFTNQILEQAANQVLEKK